jgi:hypothetical protein
MSVLLPPPSLVGMIDDSTSAIMYARQRCIIRHVYPNGFHCNIGSNELIIPQFNRCAFSTRRDNIDMRQCNTAEELVQLAYNHLDTISPRVIAAFWSSLAKLVQNQRGGNSRVQLNEQLDAILNSTMESMYKFDGRDIATIAISLAKIMKQVESRGQRAATGSLHRNLHNLLVGINSERKQVIFNKVISNIVLSYAKAGEAHPQLYMKFADHIVGMKDLGQFKPQELSNIIWAYATAGESHPQLYCNE